MIDGKPVIYFHQAARNGCNFYRLHQPYIHLQRNEREFMCGSNVDMNLADAQLWVEKADIIVSQNGTNENFVDWMYKEKTKHRGRFVIDCDDNIFATQPENPAYESFGTREVRWEMPDGKTIELKDGMGKFSIERNKARLQSFCDALRIADLVTTPSPVLSGIFKTVAQKDRVKVIRNFLDFDIWKPLALVKDEKVVRIGWQGGWSHYRDMLEIQNALKTIMAAYPQVILVIMGTPFEGILKQLPPERVERHEWTTIEAYPHKFKTLNLDIGLAPLANNLFNTAKSEIKWLEYSALGIPTVASNLPPYSLYLSDGQTGFLCGNESEWIAILSNLIEKKERRTSVGQHARDFVRENYDISREIEQYRTAYLNICDFRKELIIGGELKK